MFKVILSVAFKNAFLRQSRAILLILMIGFSMGVMLSIEGLYEGMASSLIDKSKRSDSGEVSIYAKDYRVNNDIKLNIQHTPTLVKSLKKIKGVTSVVSRLKVDGLSQSATKSYPASLIGVNFADEEKFGKFSEFVQDGTLDFGKRGCAIGKELAKNLKLRLGSKVIFTSRDISGDIKSAMYRIKAIINSSNAAIDNRTIFTNKTNVSSYLDVTTDISTHIALRTDNNLIDDKIKKQYNNYDVLNFKELNPSLNQMQDMMSIFNSITFFIVMFVVFIGILGVMYVSILDRVREFGIMLAIGYKYKYIRLQVIFEALSLGLGGFVFGSLVGYLLLAYLKYNGLNLNNFADGMAIIGMNSILHAEIKLSYFSSSFFAIILASILSVFLPLRKIKNLNPTEVIKADS